MQNSNDPYASGPNNFNNPNNPYGRGNQYHPGSWGPVPSPGRRMRGRSSPVLFFVLVVVVLLVTGGFFLIHFPGYTPPAFLEQLSLLPLALGATGGILVLVLLQKVLRYTPLGRLIRGLIGFAIIMVIAGAFSWVFFVNPYVGMTKTGFIRSSVNITNGNTLHFQNPGDGVTQTLCIGVDQKCQSQDGAPDALQHGVRVQPGRTVNISFPDDGNYHITSENTANMNITVDVSTGSDDGGD